MSAIFEKILKEDTASIYDLTKRPKILRGLADYSLQQIHLALVNHSDDSIYITGKMFEIIMYCEKKEWLADLLEKIIKKENPPNISLIKGILSYLSSDWTIRRSINKSILEDFYLYTFEHFPVQFVNWKSIVFDDLKLENRIIQQFKTLTLEQLNVLLSLNKFSPQMADYAVDKMFSLLKKDKTCLSSIEIQNGHDRNFLSAFFNKKSKLSQEVFNNLLKYSNLNSTACLEDIVKCIDIPGFEKALLTYLNEKYNKKYDSYNHFILDTYKNKSESFIKKILYYKNEDEFNQILGKEKNEVDYSKIFESILIETVITIRERDDNSISSFEDIEFKLNDLKIRNFDFSENTLDIIEKKIKEIKRKIAKEKDPEIFMQQSDYLNFLFYDRKTLLENQERLGKIPKNNNDIIKEKLAHFKTIYGQEFEELFYQYIQNQDAYKNFKINDFEILFKIDSLPKNTLKNVVEEIFINNIGNNIDNLDSGKKLPFLKEWIVLSCYLNTNLLEIPDYINKVLGSEIIRKLKKLNNENIEEAFVNLLEAMGLPKDLKQKLNDFNSLIGNDGGNKRRHQWDFVKNIISPIEKIENIDIQLDA